MQCAVVHVKGTVTQGNKHAPRCGVWKSRRVGAAHLHHSVCRRETVLYVRAEYLIHIFPYKPSTVVWILPTLILFTLQYCERRARCNMGAPISSKSHQMVLHRRRRGIVAHESHCDSEETKLIATVSRASVRVVRV